MKIEKNLQKKTHNKQKMRLGRPNWQSSLGEIKKREACPL